MPILLPERKNAMRYQSTRNSELKLSASQVISRGISEEGGLFVPECLPQLSGEFPDFSRMDYRTLAEKILSYFLSDFTADEVKNCVQRAYQPEKFENSEPVKLVPLTAKGEKKYMLELWHGPTCAFKDMALQILPHLLTTSLKKAEPGKEAVILVATSGDTGKAALEGFRDVPGTEMIVFYPENGVSPMQKKQMETQEGANVCVCAVQGNFDDAQTGVKTIFTDESVKGVLAAEGKLFSSANSINWGRLLPQIVYYFYSYFELYRNGAVQNLEEPVNIVVPTGNFGNILAAYYASLMGLPVKKFICASNSNNVLTDFINTGVYDRRREFYATSSPSMDILVSSNLERLLFLLSGEDSALLSGWMKELSETGCYDVGKDVSAKVKEKFFGGCCDDGQTGKTIERLFREDGYLCDTHTAVAVDVYEQYLAETGDRETPAIIASTASPYKFVQSVLGALEPAEGLEEFQALSRLESLSSIQAPKQIRELQHKKPRFSGSVAKTELAGFVLNTLRNGRG